MLVPGATIKLSLSLAAVAVVFIGCAKTIQPVVDRITGVVALEQKKAVDKTLATIKCQQLCQEQVSLGDKDLSAGDCLSNAIIPDWVCDIAHNPRQAVDDDPANQCASFRNKETHHFVEVDGNCNVIKVR